MIAIPRQLTTPLITANSPKSSVRFNSISEEDKTITQIERRLAPTRRRAQTEQSKRQIERRVSSDRRRSAFSSKA